MYINILINYVAYSRRVVLINLTDDDLTPPHHLLDDWL